MTKIVPLAVKKNKFGERVADISVTDYYAQIMEEVLEAHAEYVSNVIYDKLNGAKIIGDDDNEVTELVDVITCCVTRIDIIGIENYSINSLDEYPQDFYNALSRKVLKAFEKALAAEEVPQGGFKGTVGHRMIYRKEFEELRKIISLCIKRLEQLGYDSDKRQKFYQAVNEKNRKRGYFKVKKTP